MNVQTPHGIPRQAMTIEAFGRWSETQERKYELVDGVPRLQPWVKRNHNRITVNIVLALGRQLDASAFEIATGDFAVPTGPQSVRYADVLIEPGGGPGELRTADQALILVEVLSDSTKDVDFGEKLREYSALPGLDTYLIVSQDSRFVWQWTRGAEGEWPTEPLLIDGDIGVVTLDGVGATLTFDDIYRNVA